MPQRHCAMNTASQCASQQGREELDDIGSLSRHRDMTEIGYASIPPLSAASNTTPARSTKLNSCSTPRTKKAGPCASARSAAAGAMMAWSRAFAASRCRRPDFPSACRDCRPRSRMLGKLDTRPEFGPVVVTVFDRDRVADYQKMVAALARRKNPRRALSRQSQEHGQPAQICRPPQFALRDHPGLGREGAGQGSDQGSDRGRQAAPRSATDEE